MCNRYVSPDEAEIERIWHIGAREGGWRGGGVYPQTQGPFVRAAPSGQRGLVVGQWGLIASWAYLPEHFSEAPNNARFEELEQKPTFREPWLKGQRCIIPAQWFDEPCWETRRNVWWHFRRADGQPWGLAGLWNRWSDKATGKQLESYTMLTLNANAHPLMSRMHKPEIDPQTKRPFPLDQQDKRSVIALEPADWDVWLRAPVDEARELGRLTPVETFDAGPDPMPPDPQQELF